MGLRTFSERTIRLRARPFTMDARPYLPAVYAATHQNVVIRGSRQIEKSTYLANQILYKATIKPGTQILFVCPRLEQARLFSHKRLGASIMNSPALRALLWPYRRSIPTENIPFHNGSHVYVRAAFRNADAVRGISADELYIDEYQDLAPGELPVLMETLSHAESPRVVLTGTPKMTDNPLEIAFARSTACEWQVPCQTCTQRTRLDERVLGPTALNCPACQGLLDPQRGAWIPRNPTSTWGAGFWINHLMVPWMDDYQQILNCQREYDPVKFLNEVLGLPTTLGDHIITKEEIEKCCENRPFAQRLADIPPNGRASLVAGIDWGGGTTSGTVLVLGYVDANDIFRIARFDRWAPRADPNTILNEVAKLCQQFCVPLIAADGNGNGHVYNRLLLDRLQSGTNLPGLYAIYYSTVTQDPLRDGALWKWTVNRSSSIGAVFSRIKKRLLLFPQVRQSGTFLDEFICEVAEYDEEAKSICFTKPANLRDDALHATNYAQMLARRTRSPLQD